MRLTFNPPSNPQADYFEANFINGESSTLCRVAASASPLACTFGHLNPDSFYKFDYYAGAYAPEHDIRSDIRQISGRTPPNCKSERGYCLYCCVAVKAYCKCNVLSSSSDNLRL